MVFLCVCSCMCVQLAGIVLLNLFIGKKGAVAQEIIITGFLVARGNQQLLRQDCSVSLQQHRAHITDHVHNCNSHTLDISYTF